MQAVVRALQVLTLIGQASGRGLSLTQISNDLDLPLPTAHRILKTLIDERFVQRDHTLLYYPGEQSLRLVAPLPRTSFPDLVKPHLRRLSQSFDETAFVAQLLGPRAVCVALAESARPLHLSVRIGHELPLHAAASARVLLAHTAVAHARQLLEASALQQFTTETPASVEQVLQHLEKVRSKGYDMCHSELDDNVWAVSVPVSEDGAVKGSVTLTAPVERAGSDDIRSRMLDAVRRTAADIEREIETGVSLSALSRDASASS